MRRGTSESLPRDRAERARRTVGVSYSLSRSAALTHRFFKEKTEHWSKESLILRFRKEKTAQRSEEVDRTAQPAALIPRFF